MQIRQTKRAREAEVFGTLYRPPEVAVDTAAVAAAEAKKRAQSAIVDAKKQARRHAEGDAGVAVEGIGRQLTEAVSRSGRRRQVVSFSGC